MCLAILIEKTLRYSTSSYRTNRTSRDQENIGKPPAWKEVLAKCDSASLMVVYLKKSTDRRYAPTACDPPNGRKYCVPRTGSLTFLNSSCRSSL